MDIEYLLSDDTDEEGQQGREEGDEGRGGVWGEQEALEGGRVGRRREPRVFQIRACPFDSSSDRSFKKDYRFTKQVFYRLCDMVADELRRSTRRSEALSVPAQVALSLNLLGRNAKQRDSARMAGCDQATVSRTLVNFVDAVCAHASRFVCWPKESERRRISRSIFDRYRLPNIVGFIDGTHVRIIAPTDNESDYVNRKNAHSINVGLLCDDNLKFRNQDST
ncbi:hypothetical protein Y032_1509g3903 [Ancylostoma ceylanicum]|uniref:Nuclease HARBI1 n=1 Tax=Ancylostoma ceylanicum TaxID=53326 RepID=A0A016W6W2_9BILA|nr:hypothetical protein Y032_1509g3903 [Ancylostoma ceylanicum]